MSYKRINLDGKSETQTMIADADIGAGEVMYAASGTTFKAAASAQAGLQLYVANAGHLQGLGTEDDIQAGDSIEGEIVSSGRHLAVLVKASEVLVQDTPLQLDASGILKVAADPADAIAYSQEARTIGATGAELVHVRIK